MAEQLINRDAYLQQIAEGDSDLISLVELLERYGDPEITLEAVMAATRMLDSRTRTYELTIDEMKTVYELIRDRARIAVE